MRLHKFKLYVKVTVRRLSNPVFFMLLALSLCLWYITKLSYVYTTDITWSRCCMKLCCFLFRFSSIDWA